MSRTANSYQAHARSTAVYPGQHTFDGLNYTILGLVGEAGEMANKLKKIIRDKDSVLSPVDRLDLATELGDVAWYLANAATELGYQLSTILEANINKLEDRAKRGVLQGSGDVR